MKIPQPPPIEDDYSEFGGPYEPISAPPRRPRKPRRSRRSRKRPKKPKWIVPTAIAGGVLLGVLFLGAILIGLWRSFGVESLNVDEPLGYLTVESELIVVVRFDDLRSNPETAEDMRITSISDAEKKAMRAIGMKLEDIVLIAIGLKNAKDVGNASAIMQNGGMVLYQSRKKFDRSFLRLRSIKARHGGKEYLKDSRMSSGVTHAMFFPNDYTVIIASEPTIRKLLVIDDVSIARSRFGFSNLGGSLVIAQTAKTGQFLSSINNLPPGIDFVGEIPELAKILSADLRGLAISRPFSTV